MTITDLVYIDSTGYHFSDYPAFLSWLQDQYKAIYGADVYLEPDSQDGQWIAVIAKALFDTASLGGSVYNSFSPVTGQGVGLSRLVKINGLQRRVASHSTVDLTIVGQSGTVIQNGIVTDSLSQKWILPTTTIPGGGSVVATAVAENEGDIEAAPGTVTTIFTPTLGWQTVTNVLAATPGAPVESDAELRVRQAQSTANPSLTVLEGTQGAVGNLDGVTKVKAYENDTGATDVNGIPAHNVCVVVVGGDDVQICSAIAGHKTPGVGTYGDVTEQVFDAHGVPINISFQRAVTANINVQVNLVHGIGWSTDFIPMIKQAIADIISVGAIGDIVLYTKLFAPAYLNGAPAGQTYVINSILIGKNMTTPAATNIALDFDENPVCDPTVNVVVNVS